MAILSDRLRAVLTSQFQGHAEEPNDVCRMMECHRLTAYRAALKGTVEVLAKTKLLPLKGAGTLTGKDRAVAPGRGVKRQKTVPSCFSPAYRYRVRPDDNRWFERSAQTA